MYRLSTSEMVSHDVTETCSYSQWASREILCERNFMEVSPFALMVAQLVCVCGEIIHPFPSQVSNYMVASPGETKGHHSLDIHDPNLNLVPDVRARLVDMIVLQRLPKGKS